MKLIGLLMRLMIAVFGLGLKSKETVKNKAIKLCLRMESKQRFQETELWAYAYELGRGVKPDFAFIENMSASKVLKHLEDKYTPEEREKKYIPGLYCAQVSIKDHDEVMVCKREDKFVPFFELTNFTKDERTFAIKNYARLPLIRAKCFYYETRKIVIINSADFHDEFGYTAKERYDGEIYLQTITAELTETWVPGRKWYCAAAQMRLMPILYPDRENFVIKGKCTVPEDCFLDDILKFCNMYDLEIDEDTIIVFDTEAKLGSDESRVEENVVMGISNVPCCSLKMTVGSQTRMHLTSSQHEYVLGMIGPAVISGHIADAFGRFHVNTSSKSSLLDDAVSKAVGSGKVPYCFSPQWLKDDAQTRNIFGEKRASGIDDMCCYDALHIGVGSYLVGGHSLKRNEAIFAQQTLDNLGEAILEVKYLALDRSPSLLPIGIKTVRKNKSTMGVEPTRYEDYLDGNFEWTLVHGTWHVVNVCGFLFCKENYHIVNIVWAKETLLGDFDGDTCRAFPLNEERKGADKAYDPKTLPKKQLMPTIANMITTIHECRESAKAIAVCASTIAAIIEETKTLRNMGLPAPDIYCEEFYRLACMVNGFVDLTKYDIDPVVLFGVEITSLDTFSQAAWQFMNPRRAFPGWVKDGGTEYPITRRKYQPLFTGNLKNLWLTTRAREAADSGEDYADAFSRLENEYDNVKTRDYTDVLSVWDSKLRYYISDAKLANSHIYGHMVPYLEQGMDSIPATTSKEEFIPAFTEYTKEVITDLTETLGADGYKAMKAKVDARFEIIVKFYYAIVDPRGEDEEAKILKANPELKTFGAYVLSEMINDMSYMERVLLRLKTCKHELSNPRYSSTLLATCAVADSNFWNNVMDRIDSE